MKNLKIVGSRAEFYALSIAKSIFFKSHTFIAIMHYSLIGVFLLSLATAIDTAIDFPLFLMKYWDQFIILGSLVSVHFIQHNFKKQLTYHIGC